MKAKSLKTAEEKLVLFDAHAIIHRAYHALPEFSASSTGEPTGALYGLVAMLIRIIDDLKPDYVGFVISDQFVVGYGLDLNEQYRNLPYIATLRKEVSKCT